MLEYVSPNISNKPTILLVSSGYHLYREYLLKMVSDYADVWLLLDREPSWERRYILGFSEVDTLNVSAMLEAIKNLDNSIKISGVLCWDEIRVVHTAELAKALGLPGGDPEAIARCRDKHQTRVALQKKFVPQAVSILVSSCVEAMDAANSIGYPVILKPRALGASYGVSLVVNVDQLKEAYDHARAAMEEGVPYYDKGVLVEEYMQGPEISIDSACFEGKLTPLFLARKTTEFFPYFEEVAHIVDSQDPLLQDKALINVLEQAHQAVSFRNGITHTEIRLTQNGPKIVEINARLGGGMIPYVGWFATGINPGQVAVNVACGKRPDFNFERKQVAAIRFFYPKYDAVVEDVSINKSLLPPYVEIAASLVSIGQKLILPPKDHVSCRYGYVIVRDDNAAACAETAKLAEQAFTLQAQPLVLEATVGVGDAL